ncbi:hypothetical protein ACQEVZ_32830 [Dactylosporangium sp. CA-152071]|uniref:hypothetical protein n=1 Tax=Dactylosporangium sp. CA-152071 TaxID=3239933 RepID=UPI003D8E1E4A
MSRRRLTAAVIVLLALAGCGSTAKPGTQSVAAAGSASPSVSASASDSPSPSPSPSASPSASVAASVPATGVPAPKTTTGAAKPTTTKPAPPKTTAPAGGGNNNVHPGAFCSPEGAIGHTSTGTLMRCTRKPGEDRARWRAAT